MIVRKQWYVIYEGKQIIQYGDSTPYLISTTSNCSEFDTEQELIDYIEINNLVEVTNE